MAKTQTRVVTGRCPTHGIVQGSKELPTVSFPFILYGIRRAKAAMTHAQCPQCGTDLSKV
jgi:hypothetical protein